MRHLFFALLTILVLTNEASSEDESFQAEVLYISGEVSVQKAGQTEWSAASEGMLLSEGDTIRAAKGASADLSMDEGDNITAALDENTTAILRGKTLKRMELSGGSIRSLIKRAGKGSSFEIKTPTVIAGARGSGWEVDYDGESTTVKAFEDSISVESIDEKGTILRKVSLRPDFQILVDKHRKFGDRKLIKAADKNKWKRWKEIKRPPRKNIKGKMAPRPGSGNIKHPLKNSLHGETKTRRR